MTLLYHAIPTLQTLLVFESLFWGGAAAIDSECRQETGTWSAKAVSGCSRLRRNPASLRASPGSQGLKPQRITMKMMKRAAVQEQTKRKSAGLWQLRTCLLWFCLLTYVDLGLCKEIQSCYLFWDLCNKSGAGKIQTLAPRQNCLTKLHLGAMIITLLETKGLEKECNYLSKERPSKTKAYETVWFRIISKCGH